MSKTLTLSRKLFLGFTLSASIAGVLGGIAISEFNAISHGATHLSDEYIPEVALTAELKNVTDSLRLSGRSFATTGKEKYLTEVQSWQSQLEANFAKVKEFADTNQLDELQTQLEHTQQAKTEYLAVLGDVAKLETDRKEELKAVDDEFVSILKVLDDCTQNDFQLLTKGREEDAAAKQVQKRIELSRGVREESEQLFLDVKQAIVSRNMASLVQTSTKFDDIEKRTNELLALNPEEACAKQVQATAQIYRAGVEKLIGTLQSMDVVVGENCPRTGQALSDASGLIIKDSLDAALTMGREQQAETHRGRTVMITGVSVGFVASFLVAWLISRSITRPIKRISQAISSGSNQTLSASQQVASASQSLAQGTSEQAASLEESSSALEEMSSMIKKNADTSQQANTLSQDAKHAAETGTDAMNKMNAAIVDIERSALETAKIIKTIDEIAFQTNLLALNAAVEAARAGEAGKGFAVVAEEVRNLAMRSAEAAKNTSSLIEESVSKAKNGVVIAGTVSTSLTQINQATVKVTGLVNEIAAASKEQATGIDQISQAVGQMDKVTQMNAANSEESAAASEELNAQSVQLQDCVRELNEIIGASEYFAETTLPARISPKTSAKKRSASRSMPDANSVVPLVATAAESDDFSDFTHSRAA